MRYSKYAGVILGAAMLFSAALPASASSLTSAQVSAIIQLLQSFNADQSVIANVQATLGGTAQPPPVSACVDIYRNLARGSTGSDVFNLQNYLATKGYFNASATSYYGSITAQAVGNLQVALGIVYSANDTAYGIFGPRTRAAIGCRRITPPPPLPVSVTFSATPTSGWAPLAVNFNANGLSNSQYVISYGDGQNSGYLTAPACMNIYGCPVNISHTYTIAGTYTAKLSKVPGPAEGQCNVTNPNCFVIAIATITVGGTPPLTAVPTAAFTVNGATYTTVSVGDSNNYAWSSTNGTSAKTTVVIYNASGAVVAGPFQWGDGTSNFGNTLSGSRSSTQIAGEAGQTIVFTYVVTNSVGQSATTTATKHVR